MATDDAALVAVPERRARDERQRRSSRIVRFVDVQIDIELMAYRQREQPIELFVDVMGGDRSRVIAGTDCGFSTIAGYTMVAEDVVWAKLKVLSEGAKIASRRLWG